MSGVKISKDDLALIYTQGRKFAEKTQNAANEISKEIKGLNQSGAIAALKGGQGDSAVEAIQELSKGCTTLFTKIQKITKYVDSKLKEMSTLAKDKHGFSDSASNAKKVGLRRA